MAEMVTANSEFIAANNGKIFEGMKISDANKDPATMCIFNFADLDGNSVISRAEAERYNGPIFSYDNMGRYRVHSACVEGD